MKIEISSLLLVIPIAIFHLILIGIIIWKTNLSAANSGWTIVDIANVIFLVAAASTLPAILIFQNTALVQKFF
jgi:hypothetical protein